MSSYEPSPFVESVGYQPVEFLDIPPMRESLGHVPSPRPVERPRLSDGERWRLMWAARRYISDLVEMLAGGDTDVRMVIGELEAAEANSPAGTRPR